MKIIDFINKSIVTFFFVGKIPYAPGTFGSLSAFPLLVGMYHFAKKSNISSYYSLLQVSIFFIILLTFIGIYAIDYYILTAKNQDPSEVVIDEVVGQLITIIGIYYVFKLMPTEIILFMERIFKNIYNINNFKLFSSFILFRLFDILKPWPVSYADRKIKGGIGVMLDDIFAAGLAILSFFIVIYIGYFLKIYF